MLAMDNRDIESSSVSNTEPNSMKDAHKTSKRWFGLETFGSAVGRMVHEILDPKGPIRDKWNVIFAISCLFAVLLDPLFLYIPLINQDVRCIRLDNKLKIAAVLFRSITDFVYIVKIIFQIYELKNSKVIDMAIRRLIRLYILLDILAVLPIPQVTILVYFTKMRGSGSLNSRKFFNFLVLIQYVPRVLRIYLACKEIENPPEGKLGLWIKGGLNFLMYIFACHIMGGFWYFFSVQRMIACWQYACRDKDGCKPSTLSCHDQRTSDEIKLLKDSCPINPSDATIFDFGIFLDALQSGVVGSTDYSQKLSNCFWWGLKNLSSLGSDLQPSTNTWENLFAALTSIIGLLLFLYLIGKVQMYMQVESESKEQLRWQTDLKNMMIAERKDIIERSKGPEVEQWLVKNGLPMRLKPEIMAKVIQVDLAENRDVDVENVQSILPVQLQNNIIAYKEKLEQEGEKIEKWLSENLLPRRFKTEIMEKVVQPKLEENSVVDVNNVLSMLPSQLRSYIESYMQKAREKDEETGMWLSKNDLPEHFKSEIMEAVLKNLEEEKEVVVENILSILPVPLQERIREYTRLLKIERKMTGKEIDLWLLKNGIPSSKKWYVKEEVRQQLNKDVETDVENFLTTVEWIQEFMPLNRLKKVKLLENLDERVLKAICEHLDSEEYIPYYGPYADDDPEINIVKEGQPLKMILFVEGSVSFQEYGYNCQQDISGKIWGEELLVWPASTAFPAELPLATHPLYSCSRFRALILTAADMKSIGSKFRPQFDLLTSHWLPRLKKVPKLQCMDDEVLKAIFLHLKQDTTEAYSYQENQPLVSMNFIIEGCIKFTRDDDEYIRRAGQVYGEELLDWVSDTSFPALTPFATHTLKRDYDNPPVVLSITTEELKSVGSKFSSFFSTLRKESQPDLFVDHHMLTD